MSEQRFFSRTFSFELGPLKSIAKDSTIRLPFGAGRTSPINSRDVPEATASILASPASHIGKVYGLTGTAHAAEYSCSLGRIITYVDVPLEQWRGQELRSRNLPEHVFDDLLTMDPPCRQNAMIVSHTMTRRSQEGPRRAPKTMLRVTPSCSSHDAK
jgi:uncharacterized protein YbjT (DUF2867 family)